MYIRVYYENKEWTMGWNELISIFRLFLWLLIRKINPKEKSWIYYIRKLETEKWFRI